MYLKLNINSESSESSLEPVSPFPWTLHEHFGLTGVEFACGIAYCVAWTIDLERRSIRACVAPVAAPVDKRMTTVEGLGTKNCPRPVQVASSEIGVRSAATVSSARSFTLPHS